MRFSVPDMPRSAELADATVRWCAILLTALLPFFFFPVSWITAAQAKMFLIAFAVLVATLAWAWGRFVTRSFGHPKSILTFAALSLPIVYTVSALASGRDAASFVSGAGGQDTVAGMFLLFALLFLSSVAFDNVYEATKSFVRSLTVGGLALVVIQILHLLFPSITFGVLTVSASSLFGSWHELGVIAGLFAFLSLTLWGTPLLEDRWKWVSVSLGVLFALLLFVVNMTDVWYVFGILVIAFGIYQWRSSSHDIHQVIDPATRAIAMVVIGLVALISGYASAFIFGHMPARLQVMQAEVRPSWQGTFAIGRQVFTGTGPVVFGSGPNTFTRQWSLYKPLGVNSTNFWDADFNTGVGFIPTVFVTVGLLGLLSWLALGVALMWVIIRFARSRRQTPLRATHTVLLAAALYLAIFHIMYAPGIGLSALMFILFGLVALIGPEAPPVPVALRTDTWMDISRTAGIVLVALAVVLAAGLALRAALSDVLVNRGAAVYSATGDTQHSLDLVQDALFVYGNNDRAHRAAVELGLLQLQRLAAQGGSDSVTVTALQEAVSATIQHGLAAVMIDSSDYRNWLSLATLYQNLAGAGVQGAYENARIAFQKARDDNPGNPQPLLSLAQLAIAESKPAEALDLLNQAIALKPDFAAAYYLRSQIQARAKNFVAAGADANAVVRYSPDDPLGWYNLGLVLYAMDDFPGASQSLERAIALQADYANALFVLGLSYEKLGRHSDALAAFTRVSQLNPGDAALPQMIQNIRTGKPALSEASSTPDVLQ